MLNNDVLIFSGIVTAPPPIPISNENAYGGVTIGCSSKAANIAESDN